LTIDEKNPVDPVALPPGDTGRFSGSGVGGGRVAFDNLLGTMLVDPARGRRCNGASDFLGTNVVDDRGAPMRESPAISLLRVDDTSLSLERAGARRSNDGVAEPIERGRERDRERDEALEPNDFIEAEAVSATI